MPLQISSQPQVTARGQLVSAHFSPTHCPEHWFLRSVPVVVLLCSFVVFFFIIFFFFPFLKLGTRHILETMQAAGHHLNTLFLCGGLSKNPLFVQMHADITGKLEEVWGKECKLFYYFRWLSTLSLEK